MNVLIDTTTQVAVFEIMSDEDLLEHKQAWIAEVDAVATLAATLNLMPRNLMDQVQRLMSLDPDWFVTKASTSAKFQRVLRYAKHDQTLQIVCVKGSLKNPGNADNMLQSKGQFNVVRSEESFQFCVDLGIDVVFERERTNNVYAIVYLDGRLRVDFHAFRGVRI
jgi:hypothetical protein